MSVPIFAKLLWQTTAVPGTAFVTNHRLLWEVSDAPLPSTGGSQIETPDYVALPIHSIDSLRPLKKSQAAGDAADSAGTAVEILVKYAAHPGLRLRLADPGAVQLTAALIREGLTRIVATFEL